LKNIKIKGWVNTSFRRTSEGECQHDGEVNRWLLQIFS
jgi:hypothetical protein